METFIQVNSKQIKKMVLEEFYMLIKVNIMVNGQVAKSRVKEYVYSGNWHNNKKHGTGTYVFAATGMKYIGEWYQNKFLKGKWTYPNGTYFEGQFQGNKPKGQGTWHFENGNTLKGAYDQLIVPLQSNKLGTQLIWAQQ